MSNEEVTSIEDPLFSEGLKRSQEALDRYEKEFAECFSKLREAVKAYQNAKTRQEQETNSKNVQKLLDKAGQCLASLEMQCTEIPTKQQEVKNYRRDLNKTKQTFESFKLLSLASPTLDDQTAPRREMSDEDEEAGMDDVVRKKAQETTKLIKNSNKRLDSAIKIMDDTERMGTDMLGELGKQGEKIHNSTRKVQNIRGELRQSSRIIGSMERRALITKLSYIGCIILLVIVIMLILYFGFIKRIFG